MKILGIITEYNPMHNGHLYHIQEAKKKTNATHVICIMSGNFTQQGNVSTINKFDKANLATKLGVDIVIELPTLFAISSAEFFAKASIQILDSLNCIDVICFGSECNNISELYEVLNHTTNNINIIDIKIKEYLTRGLSYSNARINSIIDTYNGSLDIKNFFKSNNILGLEYLRELKRLNSNVSVEIIHRETNFNSNDANQEFMSATGIRENLNANNYDIVKDFVPEVIYNYLDNNYINIDDELYKLIRYNILVENKNIVKIDEITEGLENRIIKSSIISNTYNEFIENCITKRYSIAKIKRIMLKILFHVTKDTQLKLLNKNALYCRILALNSHSKEIISIINKNASIPVLMRFNDTSLNTLAPLQRDLISFDILATNIYNIITNNTLNSDYYNKL